MTLTVRLVGSRPGEGSPDGNCVNGPKPSRKTEARYRLPLMTRAELASRLAISDRRVDRWIADGLPARNVFGLVRFNPVDVEEWLRRRHDPTLPHGFVSEGLE